ncbi:subtilisin-like protease SBT5.6 [Pistacia vera]|uniref:subtilisin-like protease SBT5.6 n=1 Tax=Pistacia vera TaxID=55513 RepID=UPI001262C557|nr:subtilisin-like protease SBT5.6 [Pistacia vera]
MGSVFAYLLCLLPLLVLCADQKQVYIVRIREQKSLHEIEDTHHSYLLSVKNDEGEAKASRLYSYKYSFNGFAAELTPDEASKLSAIDAIGDKVSAEYLLGLGSSQPLPIEKDPIAIGALMAVKNNFGRMCSWKCRNCLPGSLAPEKTDITAPGLNILAAWSEGTSVSGDVFDNRNVTYNLQSGTSMAAPHIAASATLIKALHPDWSSAAIRSAIMTTASTINNQGSSITDEHGNLASPFMMGCGQFRPVEAADPGLIYDASYDDYLHYICNLGGSTEAIDPSYKCPQEPLFNLNYPSLAIRGLTGTAVVNRRVTHVGSVANTVYNFIAKPPKGITVDATPNVLQFQQVGQILSFTLTIRAVAGSEYLKSYYGFGSYSWTSGNLSVVSPMAISLK